MTKPIEPAWIPCPDCDDYYCTIHDEHAADCPCPPVEEWDTDPYTGDPINWGEHSPKENQ